jgi:hypothetical protein
MKTTFCYNELEIMMAVQTHARHLLLVPEEAVVDMETETNEDGSITITFEIDTEANEEMEDEETDDDE